MAVAAPGAGQHLLERETVLDGLLDSLNEARKGHGRLVLVSGEAGVGKTAVVRSFCDEVTASTRVLWGECDALFTPRPLGPFVDIARAIGGAFEGLVEGGATPHLVASVLLEELAAGRARVLVLEDVHWADEATLDVLRVLGRRLEGANSLVVATYRDDELDRAHPLRIVLGDLATSRVIKRLKIAPLSRDAVAVLAGPYGVDASRLYDLTAGNPFFVTEALAAGEGELPHTVRDAVFARVARLQPPARALLEAVAVVPPRAELWLLEAIAREELERFEECLATGVLTADSGAVGFRHELARVAIHESLPLGRKVALHRAVLAALSARDDSPPSLARLTHHAEAAGDTRAVLRYAPPAARHAASVGAHREAAALYEQTLRHSDALEPSARADLLKCFSTECYLADRSEDAIDALEAAVAIYRGVGDRLEEGDTLRALSHILWCPGRGAEARAVGSEAIAVLDQLEPSRELALAYMNQSLQCRKLFDLEDALRWAARAADLATTLGDSEAENVSMESLGVVEGLLDLDTATARLELAYDLALKNDRHRLAGSCIEYLGEIALHRRAYRQAQEYLEAGDEFCARHGLELNHLYVTAYRARVQLDIGRWGDAATSAEHVLRQRFVSTFPRTVALCVLALVRARRGDPGADTLLDEANGLAEPTGELPRIAVVAAARAELAWLAGRSDQIEALTEGAFTLALAKSASRIIGELARWRARAGLVDAVPDGIPEPDALQLAGEHKRAAAAWAELGCPYEAALALADANEEQPLREALEALRTLEARSAVAIVSRRLRELGVRGIARGLRPSTRENAAQLTARERDVLRLLADGHRNAAIAERLFLSPRTVEHHVSNVLRKLNVQSRGEAVAAAGRLALLEDT